MNKKYVVTLTAEERAGFHQMISEGKAAARKLLHVRILLKADASPEGPCWTDEQICEALEVSSATVGRVRQQFVEQSLTAALKRRLPRGHRPRRLDGEAEAHLIALACAAAPAGHARWTIRLLAGKLVELGYVARVGRETVRQVLKNELKPWQRERYCIPPQANAAFVCQMEGFSRTCRALLCRSLKDPLT